MANKEIILTPEGRQKLVEELEYREGEKHDEIVERIKEARGFGDLSENAEYDAAKEEQSQNESRVNEIRHILATAKVVESGADAHLSVSIGTTVELEDAKGKRMGHAGAIISGTSGRGEDKIAAFEEAGVTVIRELGSFGSVVAQKLL